MSNIQERYTASNLRVILNITRQAIWERSKKEEWPIIAISNRLGGNAFPYSGLPDDVKAAIAKHEAAKNKSSQPQYGAHTIPDWSHKLGLARFQIVAAWRTHCKTLAAKKVKKAEATDSFLNLYAAGKILPDAQETVPELGQASLYRWDKILRENGDDYHSICDLRGKWTKGGAKGLGQMGKEAEEAFLSLWLTPNKPSVTLAHTGMSIQLEKMGLPVPSISSAYRYAERFEANHYDLVVLKREGEKALNDKVSGYITRNPDLLEVGDCLFADGHTLNFECISPETGKPFRPVLLVWFDWKSAMPVGWEIMPTENIVAIASGLRMAIINLGKYPKVAYLDNGRAFKSKYFTETDPDFEALSGLYGRLGIALQLAKPYHGQSKVVERFFRTFNEQCARMMPSYTGRNIDDKPAWRNRNEKYHKTRHDKRAWVPTLEEALSTFKAYVEWYADLPHPRNKNVNRGEIYQAGRGHGVDTAELDRHFLWTKTVKPSNAGFTLAKMRYVSDRLYGLNKKIIVKYSWADLSVVYLYDLSGHSLGVARPQVEIHPLAKVLGDAHDQAMVADQNRRIAAQKKSTMQAARVMDGSFSGQPGLNALPYTPTRKVAKKIKALPQAPMSEEKKAELEAIGKEALEQNNNNKFTKPLNFGSEFDRYEWLFSSRMQGYQPDEEEQSFMTKYEASREYKESTGARYEQLKEVFGMTFEGGIQ